MHLKQVIVCGFRSYKDQVAIEPFSQTHNVVIGRNGTGKSNFFDAIRFGLLTARFSNLRPDERQALLHEGAGKHVMSAYVEIVFDNTDGRLPVDSDEVVLRRTIGVKKDEFFLNRKHITKADVIHLLESAGFSRSNPYYIVQQGKVNALAVMKEKERLELLKEVAGTKVYEDRRQESLKIMNETQSRREKIQEVIKYIEERLTELEAEKKELTEYQQLDREQRALEYTMHEKELQSVRMDIEAVERKRTQEAAAVTELRDKQESIRKEMAQLEANKQAKEEEFARLTEERKTMESERTGLMETRYQLELEVKELEESIRADSLKRSIMMKELQIVMQDIDARQRELDEDILPQYKKAEQEYETTSQELNDCIQQSDELIAKQGRKAQFKTQKERDAYLKQEISELDRLVSRKQDDATSLRASIKALSQAISVREENAHRQRQSLQEQRRSVEALGARVLELKEERNELSEERKEKWRLENQISYDVRKLTEQLNQGESVLHGTMSYDVRRGLQAVREMRESGQIRGIFGPLIELVEPMDERLCIAIDEAAGGSLFHVVVDTDDTAAKIMRELERKNLGRITFLPLNCLKVKEVTNYPRNDDVMPLIDKLRFPPEIRKAVLTAFGKKLLCRDLETCAQYAEQSNMDCLTLDGDMVQRRGALNGGYKDPQRSRTRAMIDVRRARLELDEVNTRAKKVKFEAQQADQRVASVIGEIQKQEAAKEHAFSTFQQLSDEVARVNTGAEKANIELKKRNLLAQEREVRELMSKIDSFRSELKSKMSDTLTDQETSFLQSLSTDISRLQTQQRDQKNKLEEMRLKKESVETVLTENLIRRRQELSRSAGEGGVEELVVSEREETLKAKRLDLANASGLVDENSSSLKIVEQRFLKLQEELTNEKSLVESLQAQQATINLQIQEEGRDAEKTLNRRARLIQKREDAMKNIRELGTLPTSELEKFQRLSFHQVIKHFNKRNEKLKEFGHVNKKALDQYVSFNEQRRTLLDRKQELDGGYESIKDLIDVLDRRKDDAILRTFKGVSHHFSEVFHELVPTGEGKMLMIRADSDSSENTQDSNVDTFSGVQIKVSFRGEGDSYLMQQLSGGQKALVALAFIFAIQRCDPAPFYLFDEVDQALDSTHRAAVAALIHRQAHSTENPAQVCESPILMSRW